TGYPREPGSVQRQAVARFRRAPDLRRHRYVAHREDGRVQRRFGRRLHLRRGDAVSVHHEQSGDVPGAVRPGLHRSAAADLAAPDFAPYDFAGIDRSYVNVDLFGQDDWEVRRGFTLNLGVRYEKQTSSPDSNNIMPRTGFAWDLNKDGRTVIRGGYGRFYDQLFDNIPNTEDLFGIQGNFSILLTPGGNQDVYPTFRAVFPSLPPGASAALGRTVTLDLGALDPAARKTPFSDQATIGIARELRSDLALTVDYTYLRGRDLFRTIDLNGPSAFDTTTGATRTVAQADATRPYGSPSRVPGPYDIQEGGFKQIRGIYSEGNGWYNGLKFNLTKRYTRRYF